MKAVDPPLSRKTIKVCFSPPLSPNESKVVAADAVPSSILDQHETLRGRNTEDNEEEYEGKKQAEKANFDVIKINESNDSTAKISNILQLLQEDKYDGDYISTSPCAPLVGTCRFLIHVKWWNEFIYASSEGKNELVSIGEVNNWRLLHDSIKLKKQGMEEGYRLKEGRIENKHFISVNKKVWEAIHKHYGGGPALPRFFRKNSDGKVFLDIRPEVPFTSEEISQLGVWCTPSCHLLVSKQRQQHCNPPNDCGVSVLSSSADTTNSCFVCMSPAKSQCSRCSAVHYCSRSCQQAHWNYHKSWCKEAGNSSDLSRSDFVTVVNIGRRGRVGLQNLGNSCYLNSILQCLSHIQPLTSFFLSNAYVGEVNEGSLFGTKGRLVREYASLIQDLWFDNKKVIYPKTFKLLLGKLNEDWAGSAQHDTEEVMVWILDKLHEDLSRIKKKPYVEKGEGNGTNCVELAAEEWRKGKLREDSMVKDIVGGQIRSRLLCPDCDKVGVSFDPYFSINVEIKKGVSNVIHVQCMYLPGVRRGDFTTEDIHNNTSKPMLFSIAIEKGRPVSLLRQKVAEFIEKGHVIDLERPVFDIFRMNEQCTTLEMNIVDVNSKDGMINKVTEAKFAGDGIFAVFAREEREKEALSIFLLHRRVMVKRDGSVAGPTLYGGYPCLAHITTDPEVTTCLQLRIHCWKNLFKYFGEQSPVRRRVAELKARKDVKGEVEFHRKMAANLPLRVLRSNGKGRIPTEGKNTHLKWQLDVSDLSSTEALYASLDDKETGSLLPSDKETTLSSFLGRSMAFVFFAMDWVSGGFFGNMLTQGALSALIEHKSNRSLNKSINSSALTLQECLREYTKDEMQVDGNTWYCNVCKKQQIARKKIDFLVDYLPQVLIITLKRFEHRSMSTRYGSIWGHSQKIDTFVEFPLDGLDMTPFCPPASVGGASVDPPLYDLFAVCNHYGRMGFGHYSAFARDWLPDNELSEQWISYDDDSILPVEAEEVRTNAAYVLFYRRRPGKCT